MALFNCRGSPRKGCNDAMASSDKQAGLAYKELVEEAAVCNSDPTSLA